VRKPRVHITYDVDIGDATEVKELPFVMGVISDLSGNPEEALPDMKKRGFVEVDRDNFNEFLKKQNPRVAFKVDDMISGDPDKQIGVDITFEKMKDFEPEGVVNSVPVLKEMLDIRQRLKSLHSRVTSSDEVTDFLKEILDDETRRTELADTLGVGGGGDADASESDAGETPPEGEPSGEG
jgi:type VI secretion system protein ImpB